MTDVPTPSHEILARALSAADPEFKAGLIGKEREAMKLMHDNIVAWVNEATEQAAAHALTAPTYTTRDVAVIYYAVLASFAIELGVILLDPIYRNFHGIRTIERLLSLWEEHDHSGKDREHPKAYMRETLQRLRAADGEVV